MLQLLRITNIALVQQKTDFWNILTRLVSRYKCKNDDEYVQKLNYVGQEMFPHTWFYYLSHNSRQILEITPPRKAKTWAKKEEMNTADITLSSTLESIGDRARELNITNFKSAFRFTMLRDLNMMMFPENSNLPEETILISSNQNELIHLNRKSKQMYKIIGTENKPWKSRQFLFSAAKLLSGVYMADAVYVSSHLIMVYYQNAGDSKLSGTIVDIKSRKCLTRFGLYNVHLGHGVQVCTTSEGIDMNISVYFWSIEAHRSLNRYNLIQRKISSTERQTRRIQPSAIFTLKSGTCLISATRVEIYSDIGELKDTYNGIFLPIMQDKVINIDQITSNRYIFTFNEGKSNEPSIGIFDFKNNIFALLDWNEILDIMNIRDWLPDENEYVILNTMPGSYVLATYYVLTNDERCVVNRCIKISITEIFQML